MASTLKVLKNKMEVFADSLITAEALRDLITTENPGSKTVENAVATLGGFAYVESLLAAGELTDNFEIVEDGKVTGEGTRAILAEKMSVALNAKKWMTIRYTEKTGTRSSADKGKIAVA
jgi:hypothetical protein